jgi:cysteinyl-tRNA synthetase
MQDDAERHAGPLAAVPAEGNDRTIDRLDARAARCHATGHGETSLAYRRDLRLTEFSSAGAFVHPIEPNSTQPASRQGDMGTFGDRRLGDLTLYNTLTRRKERFTPIDPKAVRMYVCGPTVYDDAHIGNARPVIVFDVLFRLLRHLYGADHVIYSRNITDVDDKINARAARDFPDLPLNEAIARVTETTNARFQAAVEALGCLPPTHQPRATEHMPEMRAIIERLVARGFAYVAEDHVLFSPAAMDRANGRLPRYGALANRSLDEMIAGARVDVAPYKRDPTDFVLWKPSKLGEPGWPSPAGIAAPGRPGWHIECSAMSMATLLERFGGGLSCEDPNANIFDIHGGGIDLVFPHHENEIAQSCCAFGAPRMANVFMHNGFLQVEGRKMSKSEGNFVTIDELLNTTEFGGRRWPGAVLRLAMLKTHYRQPIDFTLRMLEEAEANLQRWADRIDGHAAEPPNLGPFVEGLADDLSTPQAVAALHAATSPADLEAGAMLLGLDLGAFAAARNRPAMDAALVEGRIAERLSARRMKDFATSDRIRDELLAMGVQIKDGKDLVTGEPVTTWEARR